LDWCLTGASMIIIVTNRQDRTADFLILELQKRKADYVRFNTEDFPQRVQVVWQIDDTGFGGYFSFPRTRVDFKDVQSVWYRRPVPPVPSPEIDDPVAHEFALAESQASLDGLWRSLDCFWVSHPDNLRRAELKLYQLKIAARVGFQLWPTLLTNSPEMAQTFYNSQDGKVVYKPLRRGRLVRGEIVSLIYTNPIGSAEAERLNRVVYAPSLLQRYVPKSVEIRVTVIANRVFAVEIHSQDRADSRHDWRRGDTARLRHKPHSLPAKEKSKCVVLVRALGLAFGAIDLVLTPEGEYVFLEINPNGQWAWIQQLCPEIPLRETLADLLINGELSSDV
jgi:glutathione synthase/RimK-type ligase-like ATP-grasp enzyme